MEGEPPKGEEQKWVANCEPVIQFPTSPEGVLVNRITWSIRMIDMLQERREKLVTELRGVDAQIQTVTSDMRMLMWDHVRKDQDESGQ